MAIAQNTTIQAYQLRKGGAPARMAILRMIATESVNNRNEQTRLTPGDWKGARRYSIGSYRDAYCHGIHEGRGQWYSHGGENFRNERDSSEVMRPHVYGRDNYSGWYTDCHGEESAIGIVAGLSHGRFIAGYRWTSNDERVYFPQVFDDETDAAKMADEHARVFAESAREDSERFDAMQNAEIAVSDALESLRDCLALRHSGRRDSDDAREAIETLREARETLADATRTYEKG